MMPIYRTNDPHADFDRWDREREAWLNSRPVCSKCHHHIQDDEAYCINGRWICDDCAGAECTEDDRRAVDE